MRYSVSSNRFPEADTPRDGSEYAGSDSRGSLRPDSGGPLLLFQSIKVWNEIEIARYRFPPGERKVSALSGHVLRLHQSDPHYLVQRLDGRTQASTETSNLITIIPANRPFEQVFQVESDDLNVVLPDRIVQQAARDSGVDPDRLEVLDRFCAEDPYIRSIGLALGAELDGESLAEQLYAESLACALAVHLVRKYSARSVMPAPDDGSALSRQVLGWATSYIEENLGSPMTIAEIANATNLSPFHFSRLFRASTGLSPYQYVLDRRTERAAQLLRETRLSIHEIARQSGFNDQSHLGRYIRLKYGVTPKAMR